MNGLKLAFRPPPPSNRIQDELSHAHRCIELNYLTYQNNRVSMNPDWIFESVLGDNTIIISFRSPYLSALFVEELRGEVI